MGRTQTECKNGRASWLSCVIPRLHSVEPRISSRPFSRPMSKEKRRGEGSSNLESKQVRSFNSQLACSLPAGASASAPSRGTFVSRSASSWSCCSTRTFHRNYCFIAILCRVAGDLDASSLSGTLESILDSVVSRLTVFLTCFRAFAVAVNALQFRCCQKFLCFERLVKHAFSVICSVFVANFRRRKTRRS